MKLFCMMIIYQAVESQDLLNYMMYSLYVLYHYIHVFIHPISNMSVWQTAFSY